MSTLEQAEMQMRNLAKLIVDNTPKGWHFTLVLARTDK